MNGARVLPDDTFLVGHDLRVDVRLRLDNALTHPVMGNGIPCLQSSLSLSMSSVKSEHIDASLAI